MTPEELITAEIAQICERTHWVDAPYATPRPYVLLQVNGGRRRVLMNKTVGDKRQQFLQVEVWADSVAEAKAVSRQIEARLLATTAFSARPLNEAQDGGDSELGRYSAQQDFRLITPKES